ncbi:hypothetical protein GCM10025734_21880 [Kitasatospora paranensis]|uniref:DNA-binding response regulator n=1 Tax=Kitasatospora paranensis TaxID=258053 RepID=UPI0031E739A7
MHATTTLNRGRTPAGRPVAPHHAPCPQPVPQTRRPAAGLLAPEEHQLLLLLAEGLPLDAVARRLSTSSRTLRRRIRVLCDRIGVRTPAGRRLGGPPRPDLTPTG